MNLNIDYTPLPGQYSFHTDPSRIKLYSGGVGSGKTFAGSIESLALALECGGDGLICAPTWGILKRVTLRAFLQILPKQFIKEEHKQERRITLVNGANVWYGSTDQPYTLEGVNLSWFWCDEARYTSKESYEILLARLRCPKAKKHSGILTSTPSMGYLYDEFGSRLNQERGLTIASTSENHHLPQQFIDDLKESYSESLYASYVDGQFVQLTGGVFPNFDTNLHVKTLANNSKAPVHVAIDFGYRRPAAIFFQYFPYCHQHNVEHCIHCLDELTPDNTPTSKLSKLCKAHIMRNNWTRGTAYVDPAGAAKSPVVGWSDIDVLESDLWRVEFTHDPTLRHIPHGIEMIRKKLKNMAGKTSLYFDKKLLGNKRGIIRAIQLTEYPEKKGEISEKPNKDGLYDHSLDALRYAVVNLEPSTGPRVL